MKQLLISFLFIIPLLGNAQNPSPRPQKHACPVCKAADRVVPIVYGRPTLETVRKAERGELKLGGCVVSESSPRFYCKKDKKDF